MNIDRREIAEAIDAADEALRHLDGAEDCLRRAGNWGIADIMGGGLFSTLMKHGRMDDAERELSQARGALKRLAGELADVKEAVPVDLRVDDFLRFADVFFDGMIADWMVQSRIRDARRQVADATEKVRRIRAQLRGLL